MKTADLCDIHSSKLQIAEPIFRDFGGIIEFAGPIATVKVFEDNSLVRELLEQPGQGRVLVVDGGGSKRCAMLGGNLAVLAQDNNWAGVVLYACVRDSEEMADTKTGVKALATHPLKSNKRGEGQIDLPVTFAGVTFQPGEFLYADEDGLIVSPVELTL